MVQQARDFGQSYQSNSCLLSLSRAKTTAKLHSARVSRDLSSPAFTALFPYTPAAKAILLFYKVARCNQTSLWKKKKLLNR